MKYPVYILFVVAIAMSSATAGDHMAPGHDHGSSTICWGYAMARSAGKYNGHDPCDAMTVTDVTQVNENYWTHHSGNLASIMANINEGDIISFEGKNHVAYVENIYSRTTSGIRLSQVESGGSTEEHLNVPLDTVMAGGTYQGWAITRRNDPDGYFTKKPTIQITVNNSFTGGQVKVAGGEPEMAGTKSVEWLDLLSLERVAGQEYGGYVQAFTHWMVEGQSKYTPAVSIVPKVGYEYTANFKNEYNIIFENYFVGVGTPGVIKVEGTQYPAPKTWPVVEDNSVNAEALNQTINGIAYTFTEWNDANPTKARTFYPTGNTTYTAHFVGKPNQVSGVQSTTPPGQNVHITWNEHSNANVNYRIYRDIAHDGEDPEVGTYKNHGTTSWTDPDWEVTAGYTHELLNYDVRAHYTTEDTEADENFGSVAKFARIAFKKIQQALVGVPDQFNLFPAHPNPFNPATTIRYDLPEASSVSLTIYDMMGREVKSWRLQQTAGYKQVVWDGKDQSGRLAPAGIYIYRFIATSVESNKRFTASRKMVLLK